MQASVIVPVHNGRSLVTQQLDALAREARASSLEVIVVDDASGDGTAAVVTEWIRRDGSGAFRLVERTRRGGPNASRNSGVAVATAEFLLFCDGDDIVEAGWAAAFLGARRDGAILSGVLVELEPGPEPVVYPVPPTAWGVQYAYGGNMATTRAVVELVGGFDERMFAGGTEFDFCFRAQACGVRIVPVPEAAVHYRTHEFTAGIFVRQFKRERGRCYLRRKHGADVVRGRSPVGWLQEWVRTARFLLANPRSPDVRAKAARRVGVLVGRLWWSIRFRVLFL